MRIGDLGIERNGIAIAGGGGFHLAHVMQNNAQLGVGFGVIGLDGDCRAITGSCLIQFADVLEHIAQIVVCTEVVGHAA